MVYFNFQNLSIYFSSRIEEKEECVEEVSEVCLDATVEFCEEKCDEIAVEVISFSSVN